jgi:hypothetical protein
LIQTYAASLDSQGYKAALQLYYVAKFPRWENQNPCADYSPIVFVIVEKNHPVRLHIAHSNVELLSLPPRPPGTSTIRIDLLATTG